MYRYPPRNKALLRGYEPLVSLNKALLGAYFLGKVGIGGWYHRFCMIVVKLDPFPKKSKHKKYLKPPPRFYLTLSWLQGGKH